LEQKGTRSDKFVLFNILTDDFGCHVDLRLFYEAFKAECKDIKSEDDEKFIKMRFVTAL